MLCMHTLLQRTILLLSYKINQLTIASPGEVPPLHVSFLDHERGIAGHCLSGVIGYRGIFQSAGVDEREIDNRLATVDTDASFNCDVCWSAIIRVRFPREPANERGWG